MGLLAGIHLFTKFLNMKSSSNELRIEKNRYLLQAVDLGYLECILEGNAICKILIYTSKPERVNNIVGYIPKCLFNCESVKGE